MVPYVIEGEGQKERMYDLYSRLLKDRIVFIGEDFDKGLANSVVGQLLFLESESPDKEITMYINSNGGDVHAAIAIYDTIKYIKAPVSTICFSEAYSAAAFILAAGAKGRRFCLENSSVMLHQASSGMQGHVKDVEINFNKFKRTNEWLVKELSKLTGQDIDKLRKDIDRDLWLSAKEAKEYGIIDEVLVSR